MVLQISICLIWLLSTAAWADLTVDGTSSPGPSGGVDRFRMYLKDEQLRVDQVTTKNISGAEFDSVPHSLLVRFTGEPAGMLLLDHGDKTVKVVATMDVTKTANGTATQVTSASVIKRGETREILGHKAQGYDFYFTGDIDPMAMTGQQLPPNMADMLKIGLSVTGTSWVVPGMDGAREFADFSAKMNENQLTIGLADAGKTALISPELSSGLKDVMAQISEHGLPVQTTTNSDVSVALEGQMAVMMQGMLEGMGIAGSSNSETIVTRADAATVDAALFYDRGVPEGYTISFLQ